MRTRTRLVALLGGMVLLAALAVHAQEPAPALTPGSTFTVEFPDLPPMMSHLFAPASTTKPSMTVFLPDNYDAQKKFPLFIFLRGSAGGSGRDTSLERKLTLDKDFICVDLPLFKAPAPSTTAPTMQLNDADYRYMWPLQRRMLDRLGQMVPNIDPGHSVLGGFSNGAHATAGIIEESHGEVLQTFAAFFLIEGGGRFRQFDLLKDRPVLLMYGSKSSRLERIQQIEQAAKDAGVKIIVHEMKDIGHLFPASEYPYLTDWLHNVVLKAVVAMPSPASR